MSPILPKLLWFGIDMSLVIFRRGRGGLLTVCIGFIVLFNRGRTLILEELQHILWVEYKTTLFEEEFLWAQKSRCDWLMLGDRNTKYFHLSTLARRRRNRILALWDANDMWVHHVDVLKSIVREFFVDLYYG